MRDDELDFAIRELTESVENHYVYENARLLGWLESYRRTTKQCEALRKIRTKVKRLKKQVEAGSSGILYDYEDISHRCGEICAYEKVLEILERYINEQ